MDMTIQQEKGMLTSLQKHKQLFTSLFFSTLTDMEMNLFASHMLMWTIVAEKMTQVIVRGLELDETDETDISLDYREPAYCAGSLVSFPSTTQSTLCYCGRKFTRRFDSRQDTWSIPKHQAKVAQIDLQETERMMIRRFKL